jgi:hypothetical protein
MYHFLIQPHGRLSINLIKVLYVSENETFWPAPISLLVFFANQGNILLDLFI